MSDRYFISDADLRGLAADLLGAGTEVVAPVATDICQSPSAIAATACSLDHSLVDIDYRALESADQLDLSRGLPQLSLKGYFLPEHEALCRWKQKGTTTEIIEVPTEFAPRVVLAAKACDAAALEVVDKVMNWDYKDELWNGRREATTIVNLTCPMIDDSCFCTAVGAAPDDVKGADGLLTPVDGGYVYEPATDKGRALVEANKARFSGDVEADTLGRQADDERAAARARVAANLEIDAASRPRLDRHALRGPAALAAGDPLQRLRRLHQRLPHLPLLRHRRRAGGGRPRDPAPLLGHLPGADLHAARQRPQPARRPARPLPPAHQPQVRHLPAEVRRGALHRLRPLHARLPRRPGPRRDPGGDRHRRPPAGRRRRPSRRRTRRGRLVNIYQPLLTTVTEVVDETADTRTLRLEFQDEAVRESFDFKAGQFGEYSIFGAGESTFCIASSPTRQGFIECSFKAIGKVTTALREANVGDTIGFRGPYGNWFPVDDWKGKDVVFVAGGIGLAPVRCVIWNVLDRRDEFGDVTIVYGARSVDDLVYKRELEEWGSRPDVRMVATVDPGGDTPDWKGEVGYVTPVVEKTAPKRGQRRRRRLRPADRGQAHAAGAGEARLLRRRRLHHAREPHEVRARQVRPLQHRARVRLQGRARLHRRADEGAPGGVLGRRRFAGRPRPAARPFEPRAGAQQGVAHRHPGPQADVWSSCRV